MIARGSQNGIGLFESREAGWPTTTSRATAAGASISGSRPATRILRNQASHNVRCEAPTYRRGCDSAALLLREQSDSNLIADNDLAWSGDGFFLSGQPAGARAVHRQPGHPERRLRRLPQRLRGHLQRLEHLPRESGRQLRLRILAGLLPGQRASGGTSSWGARTAAIAIEHGGENEIARQHHHRRAEWASASSPARPAMSPARRLSGRRQHDRQGGAGHRAGTTTRSKLRGNLFDGVEDGLVVDSAGSRPHRSGNVFLSARRWLIVAVTLDAGGNYWGATDPRGGARQIHGRVTLDAVQGGAGGGVLSVRPAALLLLALSAPGSPTGADTTDCARCSPMSTHSSRSTAAQREPRGSPSYWSTGTRCSTCRWPASPTSALTSRSRHPLASWPARSARW